MNRIGVAFAGYWRRLGFVGALSSISAVMEAVTVVAVFQLLELLVTRTSVYELAAGGFEVRIGLGQLFGLTVVALVVRIAARLLSTWVSARVVTDYEADLRARILHAYLDADSTAQSGGSAGGLQTMLTTNTAWITQTMGAIAQGSVALFSFLVMVVAAAAMNPPFVLVMLSAAVVLYLAVRPISASAKRLAVERNEVNMVFGQAIHQVASVAREIRVFGARDAVAAHVEVPLTRYEHARIGSNFYIGLVPVLYENLAVLLAACGLAALYWFGAQGFASVGVLALLFRALQYSQRTQFVYHQVQEGLPYLDEIERSLERYQRGVVTSEGRAMIPHRTLALRDVEFRWTEDGAGLEGLHLDVQQGECIGIAGPSGAGKSTLVRLLLGLQQPQQGQVLLDDTPRETIAPPAWFRSVAWVPQEGVLLEGSIEDNVRFHRRDIDSAAVQAACRRARVHDEIMALPEGYGTLATDGTDRVSGGQRQRICIARALVGNPRVLVFDEPTSALDAHSEKAIQSTLEALKGQVSIILVAHRLSTLSLCDRVVVLRDGRVETQAPPDELAAQSSWYATALSLQGR